MNTLDQVRAIIADKMGMATSDVLPDEGLGKPVLSSDTVIAMTEQKRAQIIVAVCEHFGIAPDVTATHETLGLRTARDIGAYVDVVQHDNMPTGNIMSGVGERWAEAGEVAVKFQAPGPITRAEVLARGVDDADDVTALSLIAKLGWPTEAEPMGTNPTHKMVPILPEASAGEAAMLATADALDRDLLTHGISITKDGERIPPEEFLTPAEILVDAFMESACFNNPLGRALRQFPHGDRGELAKIMHGWFTKAEDAQMVQLPSAADDVSAGPFAFRKKPVTIEAVRFLKIEDGMAHFDVPLARDVPAWINEAIVGPEMEAGSAWIGYPPEGFDGKPTFWIGTLEGAHIASPGDWIIRGVKGELYPCKPDIFALTYDPA